MKLEKESTIQSKKMGVNHHLEEELKVEEVIGRGGRGGNGGRDVSDVEFCHYSRRNGGPSRADCLVVLVVFLLLCSASFETVGIYFVSRRRLARHRYRLLRSKGFDSCGLLIRRHRNRNAALASCAIVGNFYLTISSLICLLSSRIPSHSKGKKLRSTFPFFVFLPSLSIALLPPPPFNLPAETARKWSCLFVEKLPGKIKKIDGGKEKKGHYIEEAQIADLIDAAGV
jgi:hypothetical protein